HFKPINGVIIPTSRINPPRTRKIIGASAVSATRSSPPPKASRIAIAAQSPEPPRSISARAFPKRGVQRARSHGSDKQAKQENDHSHQGSLSPTTRGSAT